MSVLFSFIGMSDPVLNCRDAAMLHIVRHYHPAVVFLYFTKGVIKRNRDRFFAKTVKALYSDIEVREIYREQLEAPHLFWQIDDDIKQILLGIHKEFPNQEILINVTSGTQQMTGSLMLVCAQLPFPVNLIQVKRPQEIDETKKDNSYLFELTTGEEVLKETLDGIEPENRCLENKKSNITKLIAKQNITTLINNYDYFGALKVAELHQTFFKEELVQLLEKAHLKYMMKKTSAKKIKSDFIFYPVIDESMSKLFDYLLFLQTKVKLSFVSDFFRAVSPAFTFIIIKCLDFCFKINFERNYIIKSTSRKKLQMST